MVKALRMLAGILIFLILLVYSLAFASRNASSLSLDFLLGQIISLPATVWLVLFLLLGCLLGFLLSGWMSLARRHETRKLKKELSSCQKKLERLQ